MKIVLLLALLVVLHYGSPQHCSSERGRKEIKFWKEQRDQTTCKSPHKSLVQLEVPEGFDYVKPSVVRIKQCSGLFCSNYPMKCLPVTGKTENKTLIVQAFRIGADYEHTCIPVTVQEHKECECRCDQTYCHGNEIFDPYTCACQCDPYDEHKDRCNAWRDAGQSVQWSKNACKCQCTEPANCGSTMEWNQGLCKCVYKQTAISSSRNELWSSLNELV